MSGQETVFHQRDLEAIDDDFCIYLYSLAKDIDPDLDMPTGLFPEGIFRQVVKESFLQLDQELGSLRGELEELGEQALLNGEPGDNTLRNLAAGIRLRPLTLQEIETVMGMRHRPYHTMVKPALPQKPKDKPRKGEGLEPWFDYFHACKDAGYAYSLKDLANDVNKSYSTIRKEHSNYKAAREMEH